EGLGADRENRADVRSNLPNQLGQRAAAVAAVGFDARVARELGARAAHDVELDLPLLVQLQQAQERHQALGLADVACDEHAEALGWLRSRRWLGQLGEVSAVRDDREAAVAAARCR